jgi:hypothetical protein
VAGSGVLADLVRFAFGDAFVAATRAGR